MEALQCIETRRSMRKFTAEPVSRELMQEIVKTASYAPSWKNTQVVRYTMVDNHEVIEEIANNCVLGFPFNAKTIGRCPTLVVQSVVNGISGFEPDGSFSTSKEDRWQTFDAGIAAEAFCLSAHAKGVASVIMGIFDDKKVAEAVGLPEGEIVTALIAVGYAAKESSAPPRKSVDELLRFV